MSRARVFDWHKRFKEGGKMFEMMPELIVQLHIGLMKISRRSRTWFVQTGS